MFNAPMHRRRRYLSAPLHPDLRQKYGKRRLTVRKGDTVKIIVGEFKDHVGKVITVDTTHHRILVEKATTTKADGKEVGRPIHPSNVEIVKLDLSDKWRRRKLGRAAEEELLAEEEEGPEVA